MLSAEDRKTRYMSPADVGVKRVGAVTPTHAKKKKKVKGFFQMD